MNKIEEKINYVTCLKYSFGGMGYEVAYMMVVSYLAFFCTDIFGINSLTVAGLMLVSKLIDAVTDPIMGFIADHTRTKFGKYRPYIIIGAPLLGLTIYLLFKAPNLSQSMKVAYIYIVYISYSLAFTMVTIPYTSLIPIVGYNPRQRITIVSWRSIMIQVGRTIIIVFSLPAVEFFGGGKVGWERYGAMVGILVTICFFLAAWSAKPYDVIKENKNVEKKSIEWKKEINLIVKNKSLIMLMIAFGTDIFAMSSLFAANMYYFKYVLKRMDLVPISSFALTISAVIMSCLLPILAKKFDKKSLYWWGSFLSIIPLAILLFNPIVSPGLFIFLITIFGFISSMPGNLAWAMLSDCIDYSKYLVKIDGNGVVASSFTFMNKVSGAIGASIASLVIGTLGFVANQEQSEEVLFAIVVLRFGMPILGYVISLISMYFYELTEDKMIEVRAGIRAEKME